MCLTLKTASGVVIVCGRVLKNVSWCFCGRQAQYLCDWKVPSRDTGTCDKPLCATHAHAVEQRKHLCAEHQAAFECWKRRNQVADISKYRERIAGQAVLMFPEG